MNAGSGNPIPERQPGSDDPNPGKVSAVDEGSGKKILSPVGSIAGNRSCAQPANSRTPADSKQ